MTEMNALLMKPGFEFRSTQTLSWNREWERKNMEKYEQKYEKYTKKCKNTKTTPKWAKIDEKATRNEQDEQKY